MNIWLVGAGGFLGAIARRLVDGDIEEGLATIEKAEVRFYRSRPQSGDGA